MNPGARTPEELESLLEDAFVIRDRAGLLSLFEDGAMLADADGKVARGTVEIGELAASMWSRRLTYLADPSRVLEARETALVIAERAISVLCRGRDGAWRYSIALLSPEKPWRGDQGPEEESQVRDSRAGCSPRRYRAPGTTTSQEDG